MSTRAVYTFKDDRSAHHVYVHMDGYPTGAADKFALTLNSKQTWVLPRYEADEFAAGFVAANKDGQGNVRLTSGPEAHGDIEYVYVVSQAPDKLLMIDAFQAGESKPFFSGKLNSFIKDAESIEQELYKTL